MKSIRNKIIANTLIPTVLQQGLRKEYDECKIFHEWLDIKGLKHTHIVNEGNFPVQYRVKIKRMGFAKGVPDFLIIVPAGIAFVEMKRIKGSRTYPEQVEWIDALNEIDEVEARICKGADEAIKFIEELI